MRGRLILAQPSFPVTRSPCAAARSPLPPPQLTGAAERNAQEQVRTAGGLELVRPLNRKGRPEADRWTSRAVQAATLAYVEAVEAADKEVRGQETGGRGRRTGRERRRDS